MSLKVWLPLNGDLHNQGCSNASVTNTGATVNTTGKIGSCYSFGTSKSYLKFDNMNFIHNFTECSVSLWLKILSWNTSYATYFQFGLGSTPWAHYIFGLLRNSSASTLCFTISNGSSATNAGCLTPALELNTWYHLTLTYTAGHCKIYVNGIQTNDYNTTIVPNFTGITAGTIGVSNNLTGYQTNCLINDFRIYDHCLSAAEVKEIAQGLVLHYKLDDITNEIVQDSSGYNHNGELINSPIVSSNPSRYNSSLSLNGSDQAIKVTNNNWLAQGMEAITINIWAKSSSWTGAHLFSCTESGGFNTESGKSGYLRFPVHVYTNTEKTSTAYKYDSKEIQLSALSTTNWNMLTFVYDSTGTRTFINGNLHHTYANTSYGIHFNTNARLFLGCEANSASPYSPYFNGQLSDFRIYCTPLLDTDIKQLYEVSAKIDNLQNTHTFEYIEDQSSIKVTKQGQIKCDEIIEDTNVKIKKDNTIEAFKFIEL